MIEAQFDFSPDDATLYFDMADFTDLFSWLELDGLIPDARGLKLISANLNW